MQTTNAKNKQTIVDIATEKAGDAGAALELALYNDLSLTEDLQTGASLNVEDVKNSEVKNFFETALKSPATKEESETPTGIGFMKIGVDFTIK